MWVEEVEMVSGLLTDGSVFAAAVSMPIWTKDHKQPSGSSEDRSRDWGRAASWAGGVCMAILLLSSLSFTPDPAEKQQDPVRSSFPLHSSLPG